MKDNYGQYLTDDDIKNAAEVRFVHDVKPVEHSLFDENAIYADSSPVYRMRCPHCKNDEDIYPRKVSATTGTNLKHALLSSSDRVMIEVECETCGTYYEFAFGKRGGFNMQVRQIGRSTR